ncbi:MAG TPA: BMP family ABC transporter substrate-binding protein [Oscillospiraceae bacterium]|nr:BMP family ABC transporter substrate-binding protein [Oscillospiraceae bacterium]
MKKLLAVLLALVLVVAVVGCTKTETPASQAPASESPAAETYEVAMITDVGTIDDKSFNQGTWEGVEAYCTANNITHKYYKPTEQSTDAYLAAIQLAVEGGAKVIVTPGYLFETPIYQAQDLYPDVHFILIDGYPNDGAAENTVYKTNDNVVGIKYAEQQSGYLAGYSAVKEGYTKLGFMGGMAVPAVVRFGYGFVQGADAAAAELGVNVEIMYNYTGGFAATPEAQALAASWYEGGTEVIFACGGAVGNSVMAAAESYEDKWVIGVDVDQSSQSETVITSATKGLAASVQQMLDAYYNDTFPGGQNLVLDASQNGVSMPVESMRYTNFTADDYNAIYAKLADGSITVLDDTAAATAAELPVTNTTVTLVD